MNTTIDSRRGRTGRSASWRGWALFLVALTGLGLTGCQSFNACGSGRGLCSSPGPFKRMGQRVFNKQQPMAASSMACEPGLISAPITDSCGPAYSTGGSFGSSPVITGGTIGEEAPPLDLSPVNPTGASSSSSGGLPPEAPQTLKTPNGTDKAIYQSLKTKTPGGSPSARRESAPSATALGLTTEPSRPPVDPLANLPTLDPPTDLTAQPTTTTSKPSTDKPVSSSPRVTSLSVPDAVNLAAPATSQTPGIRTFKVVEPRLAGGSLPSEAGWTWLADQGYKTVLDLRPRDTVRSSDVASINATGIHHVPLPMAENDLDKPAQLERFIAEISKEPSRPIFFFDTDGSRAATLWYIYQVSHLKHSPEEARREAVEIGPLNTTRLNKISTATRAPEIPMQAPLNVPELPSGPTPDRSNAVTSTGRPA